MNKQIKLLGVIGLFLIGGISTAVGQGRPHHPKNPEAKAYIESNIIPVAIEYRNDLESMLTLEEQTTLANLRERGKALREKRRDQRRENGTRERKHPSELSDAERAEIKAHRKEKRQIETAAFEIVDNHEDFFNAMEVELKDDMGKWHEEMKAFRNKGKEDHDKKEGRRGSKGPRRGRHGLGKIFSPVAFVMMDPENPRFGPEETTEISIYPNPSNGKQTISLDLVKSGNVIVELIDQEGKVKKVLFNGNLDEGKQQVEVDISDLQGTQYLYRISTPTSSDVKRLLIKN